MTINSSNVDCRYASRVQFYVDGEATPSIDVPLMDLCCVRGSGGAFLDENVYTDRFGSSSTAFSVGSSFYFCLCAPFNSHLRIVIVNGSSTTQGILGGDVYYVLGNHFNWGKYGKLHIQTLPPAAVAPYAEKTLISVAAAHGGVFVGAYLHWIGGDANYNYLEGWINVFIDSPAVASHQIDSSEDYFENGWYFWAGKLRTEKVGCVYKDNSATVSAYRFHDDDPIVFGSTFRLDWKNGISGVLPVNTNTTVRGTFWWYEATSAVVTTPAIKGDQGVPGTNGQPGVGAIAVDYLTTARSPIFLFQGNRTILDSSGNGRDTTVGSGTPIYKELIPGSNKFGFLLDSGWYLQRTIRTAPLDLVGNLTIECILRVLGTATTGIHYVCCYASSGETLDTNCLWSLFVDWTAGQDKARIGMLMEYGSGVDMVPVVAEFVHQNEPMMVAVRRTGTTIDLFINGVFIGAAAFAQAPQIGASPTQVLRIGTNESAATPANSRLVVGSLALFGSALTDGEILSDARQCLKWL